MAGQGADAIAKAAAKPAPDGETHATSLVSLDFDPAKPDLALHANPWVGAGLIVLIVLFLVARRSVWRRLKSFEIAEAKLGIGSGTITLKPNDADRQVAYQIWVELSTRKIGLPIDLDNDVISEIYDSWHQFFSVTRELIKAVPVSRTSDDSTRKIINLSIEVLNEGLRPHLTLWQARFRGWYGGQQPKAGGAYEDPQNLQKKFPKFEELSSDLKKVNGHLIAYRAAMRMLVYGD